MCPKLALRKFQSTAKVPSYSVETAAGSEFVTWTIGYQKPCGKLTYGRTSSHEIAAVCNNKRWSVEPGGTYKSPELRAEILVARKEADVGFDGGWEGNCTRGCKSLVIKALEVC